MKKLAICLVAVLALSLFGSCAEDELQQLDYSCEGLYAEEVKRFQIAEIPFGEDYEAAISESVSPERTTWIFDCGARTPLEDARGCSRAGISSLSPM